MALGNAQRFPAGALDPATMHDRDGGERSYAKVSPPSPADERVCVYATCVCMQLESDRWTTTIRLASSRARAAAVGTDFNCFTAARVNAASKCISKLDLLPFRFQSARVVYLSHNSLRSLHGIEQFTAVETLGLAGNLLDSIPELQRLAPCKQLAHLSLAGNPLCNAPYYRIRTLALLAHLGIRLSTLDGIQVRAAELEAIPSALAHHSAVLTVCTTQEARALHLAHMLKLMHVHAAMITDVRARGIVSMLRVDAPSELHPVSLSLLLTTLERSSPLVTHPQPILQLSLERRACKIYTKMRGATPAVSLPVSSPPAEASIVPETRVWQRAFAELCALQTRVCAELMVMVERASQQLFQVRTSHATRDPLRLRIGAVDDQPSVTSTWTAERSRITHDLLHTIDAQRAANTLLHVPTLPNRHTIASHHSTRPVTAETVSAAPSADAVPTDAGRSVRFSPGVAARRASDRVKETRAAARMSAAAAADSLVRKYTQPRDGSSGRSSVVGSRSSSRAASRSGSRVSSARVTPAGSRRPSVDAPAPLLSEAALDSLLGLRSTPAVHVDASYDAPVRTEVVESGSTAPPPRNMHDWRRSGDGSWAQSSAPASERGDDITAGSMNVTRAGEDAFRAAAAAIDASEAARLGVPPPRNDDNEIVSVPVLDASRVVSAVRESERVLRDALDRHARARTAASSPAASLASTTIPVSVDTASTLPAVVDTVAAPSTATSTSVSVAPGATPTTSSATTIDAAISRLLTHMRSPVAGSAPSMDADVSSVLTAASNRLGLYRDTNARNMTHAQAQVQSLAQQLQASRAAGSALQSRIDIERPATAVAMPVSHAVRSSLLPHASATARLAAREFDPSYFSKPHTRKELLQGIHDVVVESCRARALRVHLRAWEFTTAAHAFHDVSHERGALLRMRSAWHTWRTAYARTQSLAAARVHFARLHHAQFAKRTAMRGMVMYLIHRRRINRLYEISRDIQERRERGIAGVALLALRTVQKQQRRDAIALTRALAFRASRLLRTCVHAWHGFVARTDAARGLEQRVDTARLWLRMRTARAYLRTWHAFIMARVDLRRRATEHASGMQDDFKRGLLRTWRALVSSRDRARTFQRLTTTPTRKLTRAAQPPPVPATPVRRDANMRALASRVGSRAFMRTHAAASASPTRSASGPRSLARTMAAGDPRAVARSASGSRSRSRGTATTSEWLRPTSAASVSQTAMGPEARGLASVRTGGRSDFSVQVGVRGRPPSRKLPHTVQPAMVTRVNARVGVPQRGVPPVAPAGRPHALFAFVPAR